MELNTVASCSACLDLGSFLFCLRLLYAGDACIDSGALAVLQKPLKAQEVEDVIVREGIAPL